MKKLLLGLLFMSCTFFTMNGQQVDYTLEWNTTDSRYDVFVTRDIAAVAPFTNSGVTRITIALPAVGGRSVSSISSTNHGPDSYTKGLIAAPSSQPGNDFLNFSTNGGSSYIGVLSSGVKTLLISFITGNGCEVGTRLFINGSDPGSGDAGMSGVDYSQGFSTLTVSGIADEYNTNSGGDPSCMPLGISNQKLLGVSIYPNPTSGLVSIQEVKYLKSLELYSITGQLVKSIKTSVNKFDISSLQSGVYFIKITTAEGYATKKIVKQ